MVETTGRGKEERTRGFGERKDSLCSGTILVYCITNYKFNVCETSKSDLVGLRNH